MRTLTVQEESYTPPEELHEGVRESIVKEQSKYKENYDKKRYSTTFYNIGDIVYMQFNPVATGESTKLQQKFKVSQIKQWKPCVEDDPVSDDNLTDKETNSDESLSSKIKEISSSDEQYKNSRPMRRKNLPQRYQDFVLN
ncbi:hypothetical protein TKK_0013329 [Trichogramma kaykai]